MREEVQDAALVSKKSHKSCKVFRHILGLRGSIKEEERTAIRYIRTRCVYAGLSLWRQAVLMKPFTTGRNETVKFSDTAF